MNYANVFCHTLNLSRTSHVTLTNHVNDWCHTHKMSRTSHVTLANHINILCHIHTLSRTSHVKLTNHVNDSSHIHKLSRTAGFGSGMTCVHESCHTRERVMSHSWTSNITPTNCHELRYGMCHTCEHVLSPWWRVMSHSSSVSWHIDESRHIWTTPVTSSNCHEPRWCRQGGTFVHPDKESCRTHQQCRDIWMSHVTYERLLSHLRTVMNRVGVTGGTSVHPDQESCHTHQQCRGIWIGHVTY